MKRKHEHKNERKKRKKKKISTTYVDAEHEKISRNQFCQVVCESNRESKL